MRTRRRTRIRAGLVGVLAVALLGLLVPRAIGHGESAGPLGP